MRKKHEIITKDIVLAALASALLSAGKQALVAIPNIEVVTLLIMLYAVCCKPQITFIATGVFIFIETFIWGINTWVISYIIHWNFVAFATFLLSHVFKLKNRFIYFAFAILATIAFGVMDAVIYALIGSSKTRFTFVALFVSYYVRGIYWCVVHVVGNAAINIVLFAPLRDLLTKLMKKYYGKDAFLRGREGGHGIKKGSVVASQSECAPLTEEGKGDIIKQSELSSQEIGEDFKGNFGNNE